RGKARSQEGNRLSGRRVLSGLNVNSEETAEAVAEEGMVPSVQKGNNRSGQTPTLHQMRLLRNPNQISHETQTETGEIKVVAPEVHNNNPQGRHQQTVEYEIRSRHHRIRPWRLCSRYTGIAAWNENRPHREISNYWGNMSECRVHSVKGITR